MNQFKKITGMLLLYCLLAFPYQVSAEALIWHDIEVIAEVKEVPGFKETVAKPQNRNNLVKIPENANADDLSAVIAEIQRKRAEEDKLIANLLAKQKEDTVKKEQAQQKAIADLIAIQEKQKAESDQKMAAALEEMKKQQAEQIAAQQEQQNKTVQDIIAELRQQNALQLQSNQEMQQRTLLTVVSALQGNRFYDPAQNAVVYPTLADRNEPVVVKSLPEQINDYTQDAFEAPTSEADIVFSYSPGSIYRIYCKEGYMTDIVFQAGEEIQFVGGGDTVRWIIEQAQSGTGPNAKTHLYVKPVRNGIDTNLVITTNKRSYQLILMANHNKFNPIVRWNYPQEQKLTIFRQQQRNDQEIQLNGGTFMAADKLNFEYKIGRGKAAWRPTMVFDDGAKTYIKMPASMNTDETPVLFIKGMDGKLAMVNYRIKNGTFIVDRLFKEAELKNGKQSIKIKRD